MSPCPLLPGGKQHKRQHDGDHCSKFLRLALTSAILEANRATQRFKSQIKGSVIVGKASADMILWFVKESWSSKH